MSVLNSEAFHEGVPSGLQLFDLPPTQVAVNNVTYQEIRPSSQVTDGSPIEFVINTNNSVEYIDLKGSQLYVKVKVLKADGSNLPKNEKVGPVNLFLQSLFSSSEVTLQNKISVTCNNNPFSAIIKTLLNLDDATTTTQTSTQLFYADDHDHPEDPDPAGKNNGLTVRSQYISESKVYDLQGPLFHDFFQLPRYMLNQVDVKLKLFRSSPAFSLLSGETSPAYKIVILDIILLARKISVSPSVIYAHNEMLQRTNAKYFYPKTDTRIQSIATGSTTFHWENLFQGQKPNKVVVGFVKSASISGNYVTNPFDFLNCNITSICLYADGMSVMGNPLKLDFNNGTSVVRAYTNLFVLTNKWNQNAGMSITREQFVRGSTLFAFDLNPYFHDFIPLLQSGNVKLEVQFGTALTENISCIVYSESLGYLEITKDRDVIM
jgi:hypothetical protein